VNGLMHLGLTNAVWAAVLALAVAVGARWLRSYPGLVHALWLLVLLKLATPSLVQLPIPWGNVQPQEIEARRERTGSGASVAPPQRIAPEVEGRARPRALENGVKSPALSDQKRGIRSDPSVTAARSWPWRQIFVLVWLPGAAAWWIVIGLSSFRMHQLIRASRPVPDDLRERLARIAERLGLRRVPTVSLVSARVPPMLWAGLAGTPLLVLPEELWSGLDSVQQETVMAHELAHLKRRDHWVRRLEAVVLAVYWWDPIAWWARRELERAEEECCDAWVVRVLPAAAQAYVEALVTTAVFLSGLRPSLPVGASGAGRVLPLTRRLNMIVSDRPTNSLARHMPSAVLVAGVIALPFLPSLAAGRSPVGSESAATTTGQFTGEPIQDKLSDGVKPEVKITATTKEPASDPRKTSTKIRVCQPIVRNVSNSMDVRGLLEAVHQIELKSRVSGQLITVNCRPGQWVRRGQILFEIDPRPYRAEVDKAEAEVRIARSRTKGLPAKLSNAQSLQKKGFKSPGDLRMIESEIEEAAAAVQTAEADLALARLKLESTQVTSPIDGKISGSVLAAGNIVVSDSTVLASIQSIDPIYVKFGVAEQTMMNLKRLIRDHKIQVETPSELPVRVDLNDGDGFKHAAKADFGDVVVNSISHTMTWRAQLPNPDGFLMPGLSVRVRLTTGAPRLAHVFPRQAPPFLKQIGNGQIYIGNGQVYIVNSKNVVESRDVQFAGIHDDLSVFDAGLRADDWVVLDRFDLSLIGKTVEPVKTSAPTSPVADKPPTP
jgi:RND family efflux transporter MFP subunit